MTAKTEETNPHQYPDVIKFKDGLGDLVKTGYFSPGKEVLINRTPGRLDLMGGNDDYTGGMVFESTIREAILVAIQPRDDRLVRFNNPAVKAMDWSDRVEFSLDDLLSGGKVKPLDEMRAWINRDPRRAWCAYILGDLYLLMKKHPTRVQHGFNLHLESAVPLGKGVSSSAALEVAPMKVMAELYGLPVSGVKLAEWTQWVEIALTQSACGIMDQLAVVMGAQDHFMSMVCQPCLPRPLIKLPNSLQIWGIDSGIRHSVAGIEYEAARAATFMGYHWLCEYEKLTPVLDESGVLPRWVDSLWNGYLARISPALFRTRYENLLPEYQYGRDFNRRFSTHLDPFTSVRPQIKYPVRAATRYAVEENWRVQSFTSLITKPEAGIDTATGQLLGELMYQAHVGYSQCGLGSEATDMIVDLVRNEQASGLLGAKITGGGAGGTVAILGWKTRKATNAFHRVVEQYTAWSESAPYVFTGSSAGSDAFGILRVMI